MDNRSGFTFVEILITIVIIGILTGVVGLSLRHHVINARIKATELQLATFKTALMDYRTTHSRFPTQEQGLEALCVKPVTVPIPRDYPEDGYLQSRELPLDAWGSPFVFLLPGREGQKYEIISYGGDGEPGGVSEDADIVIADR